LETPVPQRPISFDATLSALAAVGEPTRLRLAALLSEAELTVTELTTILGQSQPRISRHLKLMVEAGIIERHREGAWAFFRIADAPPARLVHAALAAVDPRDATLVADRGRLDEARAERARSADSYFSRHADDWDQLRALHAPERDVENALLAAIGPGPFRAFLDLGTGTGRVLSLMADRAQRCIGVDLSPSMLAVARSNIERAGHRNVQLRHGDIYALPVERDGYDVVVIHQVLHYLDDPARAVREAARALRPGGKLLVVDFAPHDLEFLRMEHAHRRLGFSDDEIAAVLGDAGLGEAAVTHVRGAEGAKLAVTIWSARDRRLIDDTNRTGIPPMREVA
jgi:ubiquinone/menaquinone biosynthesis C-methylase UbiE/DNA-binding transcriptional ArsR family regulator